jgi:hypothetical protein
MACQKFFNCEKQFEIAKSTRFPPVARQQPVAYVPFRAFFRVNLFSHQNRREVCVYDLNTQDWWTPSFVYLRICVFGVYERTVLLHTHIRIYAYTHKKKPGKSPASRRERARLPYETWIWHRREWSSAHPVTRSHGWYDRQYWVLRRKSLIVRNSVHMRSTWFKSSWGARVSQLLWIL